MPWAPMPWAPMPWAPMPMPHMKPFQSQPSPSPAMAQRAAEHQKGEVSLSHSLLKEYEGSLKSLSANHGYGFIACAELYRMYERDVYLPKDMVPADAKVLDRLKFSIALNSKGHPRAQRVSVVEQV
mmetsp:Transcript_89567/g.253872  ORF Transcript_89567/g.253872 Transcript_89567/m.253872 type:complete len:126 (-) Transcript_89567:107-484(-)